ncbi:MAG: D-glycero-beta-D-manno-heptose-7-phosphate kinase [Deltaproteobacteria bacterium]|nr:D-glycero-beta-D-manno-heptose-7-phosphate kinase [Deltaproteobacteria bacterium]
MKDLQDAIQGLAGHAVAIVGDVMLDRYLWGRVERISPEAPVPVAVVESETVKLGGAANVAMNVKALGGEPLLVGSIGDDQAGGQFRTLLQEAGIADTHLITSRHGRTTTKTRIMAGGQQIVRVDREPAEVADSSTDKKLARSLSAVIDRAVVTIVSDYGKGVVDDMLLGLLSSKPEIMTLIDPKDRNMPHYRGAYLMTPNKKEAGEAVARRLKHREDIIKAGCEILQSKKLRNLLITQGAHGMTLFSGHDKIYHLPTLAQNVFDVTGAGDTVISVIGLGLASGLDLLKSCVLANYAAGHVVGQIGTAWATGSDIIRMAAQGPTMEIEHWQ